MRILKLLSKKIGDQKYYKYIVNVPVKVVHESGLLDKDLQMRVDRDRIIIERV